jgi:two-component system phosphate regulon sensor histidine kinase PhoR
MQELINNLCDNAIRYNKPGGTVKVTVDHDDEKVWLRVADTGIGIPKEHQKRIFERFYRVDKSRSRATGGIGLGLAIVKHIVQGMNGEIQLESELDVGTTITVLLPKQKEQEK